MAASRLPAGPPHHYPEKLVSDIQKILDDTDGPPLVRVQEIMNLAIKHGVGHYLELDCSVFLTHPSNRCDLMLDWMRMHRNGASIKAAGACDAKLGESVCFELSPVPKLREAQLAKNQELIDSAGGHIAPITGAERYLHVGCSHFTQFCKAAKAGVKTHIEELQDGNGCLSTQVLEKGDPFFAGLLSGGWKWYVSVTA